MKTYQYSKPHSPQILARELFDGGVPLLYVTSAGADITVCAGDAAEDAVVKTIVSNHVPDRYTKPAPPAVRPARPPWAADFDALAGLIAQLRADFDAMKKKVK